MQQRTNATIDEYKANYRYYLIVTEIMTLRRLICFVHMEFHFWEKGNYLIRRSLK